MSAVFLLVGGPRAAERIDAGAPWVPFEPERTEQVDFDGGSVRLAVWTVVPEAARGSYLHRTADDGCLVYDGQVAEPSSAPLDQSVAEVLHDAVTRDGLDAAARYTDGDWCTLMREAGTGTWRAATDFLGACHLYFGQRDGHVVVSNRALVAAAALWGELPAPDLNELSLLHAAFSCPIGQRTCWPDLQMLSPHDLLVIRQGHATTVPKTVDYDGDTMTFDEGWAALVDRSKAVKRFPDLRFRLTVTGGKDSRAVLGGLIGADALDAIDECYLEGDPTAPDAVVGKRLAEHYGLKFVMDPAPFERFVGGTDADLMDAFAVHNFQAELALNAWDLKGALTKPRNGDVRGYYGEIYKTHDLAVFKLGWAAVRVGYQNRLFVDPWGLLTPEARKHALSAVKGYVDDSKAAGYDAAGMHHRFHREQRMSRWCGQAQRSDGMGSLAINPLADRRLFNRYFGLAARDRAGCRIHFELIRRADAWLAAQPFADFQWKLKGAPSTPAAGSKKAGFAVSPQLQMWRQKAELLDDFLRDRAGAPAFFEVYDYDAVGKLLDKTKAKPNHRRLKAVMAACALKHAAQFGIQQRRFKVEPAA